jgi:hypothetical protein
LMPMITLFSAPKAFIDPHIAMIQRNAILSWKALGEAVEVLLLGEEEGLEQAARELEVRWIPGLKRNSDGTPLISSMFEQAIKNGQGKLMAIVNADIILLPDFVETAKSIAEQGKPFLLMGQRWDLDVKKPLSFTGEWNSGLRMLVQQEGKLHKSKGSDYFIFPREAFPHFPKFAIGRAGWDNWTIYHARKEGWMVIDATEAITVIHQQHDYSHLLGGKIHYTLPESDENLRIAGGKRHIFTLFDTNFRLDREGRIRNAPLNPVKIKRELEIYSILHGDIQAINNFMFYLLNPRKFIRHKFPKLAKTLGIKGKADEVRGNDL